MKIDETLNGFEEEPTGKISEPIEPINSENTRREAIRRVLSGFCLETGETDAQGNPVVISFSEEEIDRIIAEPTSRLLKYIPQTLQRILGSRFLDNVRNLKIKPAEWKNVVLKQPQLFCLSPETIRNNTYAAALLLFREDFKLPDTAEQTPEERRDSMSARIAEYLDSLAPAERRETEEQIKEYIQTALKEPQLFTLSPETIKQNVKESAQRLGISEQQFIQASLKEPQLFCLSPISNYGKFNVLTLVYGSAQRAREKILADPKLLAYAKARDLMHYFASIIVPSSERKKRLHDEPEAIIREHFKNDPAKAESVIGAIKEMYTEYAEREKREASERRRKTQEALKGKRKRKGKKIKNLIKIEKYKKGVIFYSLGNFVFDQMWSQKTKQGLVVKIKLVGKNIDSFELKPVIIENYFQPRWANDFEKKQILNEVLVNSRF